MGAWWAGESALLWRDRPNLLKSSGAGGGTRTLKPKGHAILSRTFAIYRDESRTPFEERVSEMTKKAKPRSVQELIDSYAI